MTLVTTEKMEKFLEKISLPSTGIQSIAVEKLREMDFPTTRNEYWKYTRLGKIANATFTNSAEAKASLAISDYLISTNYLVIENGKIRLDLSKTEGQFNISYKTADEIASTAANTVELDENQVFTTLNSSLYEQAIVIDINANTVIEEPLQLVFVNHSEQIIANNRVIVNAGKSSQSTVIFTAISLDGTGCFNNSVATYAVGENAHLTINKLQVENNTNLSVSTDQVRQDKNSTFKINTFTFSGLLVRNNINIAVAGENCNTYMNGAVITAGKQHVDNHTFVDHQVPNCYSNENYKYVLDGQSTGVFNGRVIVQKDAQVINAYQNNGNILLSDQAAINSKPELEIYADDVKCSHGSTTGQLDENALFYLQSRGISKEKGRKLLVSAFVGEIIESIENEAFSALLLTILKEEHQWDF